MKYNEKAIHHHPFLWKILQPMILVFHFLKSKFFMLEIQSSKRFAFFYLLRFEVFFFGVLPPFLVLDPFPLGFLLEDSEPPVR